MPLKLSIIVPVYNGEAHLPRCLTSLLNQDVNPDQYEILIINDGSTDRTKITAEALAEKYPQIRIVNQTNRGLGASRNIGITLAQGKYIYFIDADDYLAYGKMRDILRLAEENDLDMVGFKTQVTRQLDLFSSETQTEGRTSAVLSGTEFFNAYPYHRFEAWWYLIRKSHILDNNLKFEEGKFMEDVIFTLKAIWASKRIVFRPEDIHRYVLFPKSIMNNTESEHLERILTDYRSLIERINSLLKESIAQDHPGEVSEHIRYVQSVNVYFMFFKIIRSSVPISRINELLSHLRQLGVYPVDNLIGGQYHHPKIKLSLFLFNRKWLFLGALIPIRLGVRYKVLKLPF
ncbi:glycosyltransferase [Muriicola marianensis]|uniref:Glycosyltransferase 2-like domain-containing protein n=1 Tax=Muriicola marianensis TaxID=1324801 RepID=A0ABQ1QSL3_9FLAO|nr:glycosyltransferase [Muriicola marianensis]GGD40849.1 hypothetical protein GCM10011361_04970 [Muriicola marianensis]